MKETNFKIDLLWLFAIALITTILIISWSFEHGRLQYQMDYEDIITHIDGLKRWRDISEGGLGTYFGSYIKTPPHAPLHSMMATLGFMLFGVKDWAPYAVNALVLVAFLALVRRETRAFGSWPSWVAVVGALLVPVSFESVHEFRPDFPCALATLWGMVLYPRWRVPDFGRKAALSGLMFGLALLSKPPFFPYTLAMGVLPWMMALWEGIREKNSAKGIWGPVLQSWPFFVLTALVAGPHYWVAWRRILDYITANQFGADAHVWRMTGGLGFQLAYHVFGYSGQYMLGKDIWIFLALTGCGLLLATTRRGNDSENSRHFMRLFGFAFWAWLLIAWNPHMNPFFGLTFQYGLILAAMVSVSWMLRMALDSKQPFRSAAIVPIGGVAAMVWLAFPLPEYGQNSGSGSAIAADGTDTKKFATMLPSEVYETLKKWRPFSDSGYTLLSTYGIVSSHRLQWLANKARQDFTFYAVPFLSLEKLLPLFEQDPNGVHHVDFVMVTESGAEGVFENLPNAKTSGGLLEWIGKQSSYTQVKTLQTPSKKKYCIFMALPNFSVFNFTEGLTPKSEPLNIQGAPVVRSATSGLVSINYDSPSAGEGRMELRMRGWKLVSDVQVSCNGKDEIRFSISPKGNFIEKDFPVQLEKGENRVVIRILDKTGNVLPKPSVQFGRIRITPPGDASAMSDIIRKAENGNQ